MSKKFMEAKSHVSGPWIGFDLDGTLAQHEFDHSYDHTKIGEPIKPIVTLARKHLAQGHNIRILTARVCEIPFLITPDFDVSVLHEEMPENVACVLAIRQWCLKHIGQVVPITCMKDYGMLRLYDDRAVQVITNTGQIVGQWK